MSQETKNPREQIEKIFSKQALRYLEDGLYRFLEGKKPAIVADSAYFDLILSEIDRLIKNGPVIYEETEKMKDARKDGIELIIYDFRGLDENGKKNLVLRAREHMQRTLTILRSEDEEQKEKLKKERVVFISLPTKMDDEMFHPLSQIANYSAGVLALKPKSFTGYDRNSTAILGGDMDGISLRLDC